LRFGQNAGRFQSECSIGLDRFRAEAEVQRFMAQVGLAQTAVIAGRFGERVKWLDAAPIGMFRYPLEPETPSALRRLC
jgi:hypothetical protein